MSIELAELVLALITGVAVGVWLISVSYLSACWRMRIGPSTENGGVDTNPSTKLLFGSVELDGHPDVLTSLAASLLARGDLGPVKILEHTTTTLLFEQLHPTVFNRPIEQWFRFGRLSFSRSSSGKTQAAWELEPLDRRYLLRIAVSLQVLGAAAIGVGAVLIHQFVARAGHEAIRWQTLQMLQVCHLLWPPFLLCGHYQHSLKQLAARLESFVSNMPFVKSNK